MDSGNVAWILTSSALVALMIPGLALFYGGMVSSRRILNMMLMCFGGAALVALLWVAFGYSAVFGDSLGGLGLLGDPLAFAGLDAALTDDPDAGIPLALFASFQLLFAGVTTALVAGAAAGRMKYGAWLLFAGLWATFVYFPIAHWVFAFDSDTVVGGWIANTLGAVDFAGGTAVHMNAGIAALALAIVLGKSKDWGGPARPHNRPLVLVGAGLLWIGWYGFNAGSALAGPWSTVSATEPSPASAAHPDSSPPSSRSPRRAVPCRRSALSRSVRLPAWSAAWPSSGSSGSASTTPSTSSACTSSAASSERC